MPDLETSKLVSVLAEMPKELLEGYSGYNPRAGKVKAVDLHCDFSALLFYQGVKIS